MSMLGHKTVEYVFFFGLLGLTAYVVWLLFSPFVSALALSAIIVTICYPLYERVVRYMPKKNETLGALVTTVLVLLVVILPIFFIGSAIVSEAVSVYSILNEDKLSLSEQLASFEASIESFAPNADVDIRGYLQQAAEWFASSIGVIFKNTVSTIFLFFIAMIGTFYFFRDGKSFTKSLVIISPLPDDEDEAILTRLARAVRSVATGTILVAIIQGTLTAVGLSLFGIERAVLGGAIASVGALIPSVGTSVVFVPVVLYLLATGAYGTAIGLALWGTLAVGLIDNLLGPYLMSRGNALHPFLVLLSVLGGISLFGPIGFIVGPVIVSLFLVLLELYGQHLSSESEVT